MKRIFGYSPSTSSSTVLGIPCASSPGMPTSIVEIGEAYEKASIKTTVTHKESDIDLVVKTFLSNDNNSKKIIGLGTELIQFGMKRNITVLLELCDGDHCLIMRLLPFYSSGGLPRSLFNFLNLPEYTFVGIDIKKTLEKLESEWGLTCKNAVEIGPFTWNLNKKPDHEKGRIKNIFSIQKRPTSPVFDNWNNSVLNENQIKLATSNAYVAFGIGNVLLHEFGILS